MTGALTASTPILVQSVAALEATIESLTLAAATDFLFVLPVSNVSGNFIVFTVERAA
jgi:hypothetical protein